VSSLATNSRFVVLAEQLQVSVSPSAFTVREGERARLVCRATHGSQRTTVTWSPIPAGSTFVNRTGEFIVQQANKRQHEARYTCTAYDPLTQQTATAVATLTVVPGRKENSAVLDVAEDAAAGAAAD